MNAIEDNEFSVKDDFQQHIRNIPARKGFLDRNSLK